MSNVALTEAAKEARRAYRRKWYQANKEKVAANNARYWERKAAKAAEQGAANGNT
jgi:hypothetical protein